MYKQSSPTYNLARGAGHVALATSDTEVREWGSALNCIRRLQTRSALSLQVQSLLRVCTFLEIELKRMPKPLLLLLDVAVRHTRNSGETLRLARHALHVLDTPSHNTSCVGRCDRLRLSRLELRQLRVTRVSPRRRRELRLARAPPRVWNSVSRSRRRRR